MKPKVYLAKVVPNEVEEYVAQHCSYQMWPVDESISREKLLTEVADVEGVLLVGHKIDQELLDHGPSLKIVSNISVGYDNFDLKAMKERKVLGTNAPTNELNETVADMVFGLILATARRIVELDHFVKEGKWIRGMSYPALFGLDVHHTTLGIIGMGQIGEAIARRAKFGFEMKVLYHNRNRKAEAEERLGAQYCSMEDLLRESDYVVVMTNLTPETRKIMGIEQFKLMKKSAIFFNASRGETVDEEALISALQDKRIKGAGLDVFQKEPIDLQNPLLQMPNVVTLPHLGSNTARTRGAMGMVAAQNLVAGVTGQVPPNLVPELK